MTLFLILRVCLLMLGTVKQEGVRREEAPGERLGKAAVAL